MNNFCGICEFNLNPVVLDGVKCTILGVAGRGQRRGMVVPFQVPALNSQPLDDTPVFQMFFDDLVNIFFVHIRVPDIFGIDNDNRTFVAAIETTRIINPYPPALAIELEGLDSLLGVITHGLSAMIFYNTRLPARAGLRRKIHAAGNSS